MGQKTVLVILTIFQVFYVAPIASAQSRAGTSRANTAAAVSAQPGGPLSVGQVLEALYSLGVTRTEDLVARNKVRFEATPEIVGILKEFGATDRLLSLIPAPAAPPPPAQPKKSGPLTVMCEPVDCAVVASDKFYGTTKDGALVIDNLPPGEVTIQVFSDGFQSGTYKATLQEGQQTETRFQLALTPDARQRKGQQYLVEMIQALGGIETLSLFLEFQGDGVLDWTDNRGQKQTGALKFSKRPGLDIEMEFKTKDGSCTAVISGRTSKQSCRGGLKGADSSIDQAATLFLRYEVRSLIGELLARTSSLSGSAATRKLEASGRNTFYALTFTSDQLPSELVHTFDGRPESAITVLYSDYVDLHGGRYPGKMEIRSPDNPQVLVFALKGITTRLLKRP